MEGTKLRIFVSLFEADGDIPIREDAITIEAQQTVAVFRIVLLAKFPETLKGREASRLVVKPTIDGEPVKAPLRTKLGEVPFWRDGDGELHACVYMSKPVNRSPTFEQLLKEQGVDVDQEVLRNVFLRLPSLVSLTLQQRDRKLALEVYETAKALPGPATREEWSKQYGISMSNDYFTKRFSTCLNNGVPGLIKGLMKDEASRMKAAEDAGVQFIPDNRLVPFRFVEAKSRAETSIVMPFCGLVLSSVPFNTLSPNEREPIMARLWEDMSTAMKHLHDKGFAHCDIKPDNIFVDDNGRYLLGDHGSVAPYGAITQSTRTYLPLELLAEDRTSRQTSSASIDWWMLAVTLLEVWGVDATKRKKASIKEHIADSRLLLKLGLESKLD